MLIIPLILLIMFGPPIVLTIVGAKKSDKKSAKNYYLTAVIYLIIGLGTCGAIIASL